jgi:phosphopantetheinyl transferase
MTSAAIQLWTVDLDGAGTEPARVRDRAKPRRELRRRAVQAIAEQAGLELFWSCRVCGVDGHGRPHVRREPYDISVTWTGRWGLVALADCRVGIDAEPWSAAPNPVTSALSSGEVAVLAARPESERTRSFLRLWTAKEAVAKADGRGLTLPLNQLDVATAVTDGQARVKFEATTWHVDLRDHAFPDGEAATVAIATNRRIGRVHEISFTPSPAYVEPHRGAQ